MEAPAKDMRDSVAALLRDPSTDRLAAAVGALAPDAAVSASGLTLRAELLRRQARND